jgi:hypothetical protein
LVSTTSTPVRSPRVAWPDPGVGTSAFAPTAGSSG